VRGALPLALLAALLPSGGPAAAPCADDPDKVKVSVVTILATDKDSKVDPKLADLAREVQKVEPKLTGFRLANSTCKSLAVGDKDDFDLVADQTAAVTVEHGADKDDRVQLKVTPPMMGAITYETACGKFLPVVTSYRTKSGDVLIIAVCVQPCNGK
jgi:hypothetical protein